MYKKSSKTVLIFYREGDIKARNIIRHIIKLSKIDKYIDIKFLTLDIDIFIEIADRYHVYNSPSLVFIYNKKIERIVDDNNIGLIEDYIDELVLRN